MGFWVAEGVDRAAQAERMHLVRTSCQLRADACRCSDVAGARITGKRSHGGTQWHATICPVAQMPGNSCLCAPLEHAWLNHGDSDSDSAKRILSAEIRVVHCKRLRLCALPSPVYRTHIGPPLSRRLPTDSLIRDPGQSRHASWRSRRTWLQVRAKWRQGCRLGWARLQCGTQRQPWGGREIRKGSRAHAASEYDAGAGAGRWQRSGGGHRLRHQGAPPTRCSPL